MKNEVLSTLSNNDPRFIEQLAQESAKLTRQYFGRTISLYAPLYLSNFCSSYCTYCGFHSHNRIKRFKLTAEQMDREMQFVAGQGIENILLLTGESYNVTPLSFLKEAVEVAKNYFPSISLEVHPMETAEYKELFETGVDGITVYQETYDRKRYSEVHISGTKANFDFRYGTPQRAAEGGIRTISIGVLLGLSADLAQDLLSLYEHLRFMEKNYPGTEYSVSFPRMREIKGKQFARCDVDDVTFVKIICMTRKLFPRVGINLSTREEPRLRDHILELGITRMSAGSNTSVGGYTLIDEEAQDPQFDVSDHRSVSDVVKMLKGKKFDPVFTDWRRI
ncbi:MAG: thiamine biosynthesis protein ThiH [Omnitrophica WOR_2 bacterium GWA2_47_8]|nr:MAG: thiamine biosynthesis protein ThiH [Omnitrophica WOR_2 bacterium GWA2_47_8]